MAKIKMSLSSLPTHESAHERCPSKSTNESYPTTNHTYRLAMQMKCSMVKDILITSKYLSSGLVFDCFDFSAPSIFFRLVCMLLIDFVRISSETETENNTNTSSYTSQNINKKLFCSSRNLLSLSLLHQIIVAIEIQELVVLSEALLKLIIVKSLDSGDHQHHLDELTSTSSLNVSHFHFKSSNIRIFVFYSL